MSYETADAVEAERQAFIDRADYHRILLPEAKAFGDLFSAHEPWDGHEIKPRHIPAETPDATAWERSAWRNDGRNEIGPYLYFRDHRPSMAVRATDAVMEVVTPRLVTPDDTLSFEIVEHESGFALVILSHGYIIGSHWLAYIYPDTIPS